MLFNNGVFAHDLSAPAMTDPDRQRSNAIFATYFNPDANINELYTETCGLANPALIHDRPMVAILFDITQACCPGFDCIILVRKKQGGLSSAEQKNISFLHAMFGDAWLRSTILVHTHANEEMSREKWADMNRETSDPSLRSLLAVHTVLFLEHTLEPAEKEVDMKRYFNRVKGLEKLREALDQYHEPIHTTPATWEKWLLGVATAAFGLPDKNSPHKPVPMQQIMREIHRMVSHPKRAWKRRFGTCLVCQQKIQTMRYEGVGLAPCCSKTFHDKCLAVQAKCPACLKKLPVENRSDESLLSPTASPPRSFVSSESPFLDASGCGEDGTVSSPLKFPRLSDSSFVSSPAAAAGGGEAEAAAGGGEAEDRTCSIASSLCQMDRPGKDGKDRGCTPNTQLKRRKRQRVSCLPALTEGDETASSQVAVTGTTTPHQLAGGNANAPDQPDQSHNPQERQQNTAKERMLKHRSQQLMLQHINKDLHKELLGQFGSTMKRNLVTATPKAFAPLSPSSLNQNARGSPIVVEKLKFSPNAATPNSRDSHMWTRQQKADPYCHEEQGIVNVSLASPSSYWEENEQAGDENVSPRVVPKEDTKSAHRPQPHLSYLDATNFSQLDATNMSYLNATALSPSPSKPVQAAARPRPSPDASSTTINASSASINTEAVLSESVVSRFGNKSHFGSSRFKSSITMDAVLSDSVINASRFVSPHGKANANATFDGMFPTPRRTGDKATASPPETADRVRNHAESTWFEPDISNNGSLP
eukprot:g66282.t1